MDEAERRSALSARNLAGVEAFQAGDVAEAVRCWEDVARQLTPSDDDWAPLLYENLGLAYYNLGWARPAEQAFLRALDGDLVRREQSARHLVGCALNRFQFEEARRRLDAYLAHFGPHPDGWTYGDIEALERHGRLEG